MDYSGHTKEQLIEELKQLEGKLNSLKISYPGLKVINKFEASLLNKVESFEELIHSSTPDFKNKDFLKKALLESEERFKKLSEATLEAIVIHVDGVVIEINTAFTTLSGYTKADVIGKDFTLFVSPESIPVIRKKVASMQQEPYEIRAITKDGKVIICEVVGKEIAYFGKRARVTGIREITSRKKAEQDLIKSEKKYRFLFEKNPVPMFVYDRKTLQFLDVNQAAINHYGYTRDEFLSMTILGLREGKEIKRLKELIKLNEDRSFISVEVKHKKKNGEIIDVEVTRNQIDSDRNIVLVKDITEQKLQIIEKINREEKLKNQNKVLLSFAKTDFQALSSIKEYYELITQKSAIAINVNRVSLWFFDSQMEILELKANYQIKKTKEKGKVTIQRRDHLEYFKYMESERILVVSDARLNPLTSGFTDGYHDPLNITSLIDVPIRYKGVSVGVICFEHSGPLRNWDTDEINFASSVADIVTVALNADERRKAEQALIQSEEQFRMLAENAIDVVFRYSIYPENKYEYVSPSIEELTGFSPNDFYNDPYFGFKIVHEDDLQILGNSQPLLESKVEVKGIRSTASVLRWKTKDGRIIWTETRNRPISDSTGRIVAIEGISRDITKRIYLEQELLDSKESYKMLVDALPGGILIYNEEGIQYANKAAFEIFGIDEDSASPIQSFSVMDFILPQYHQRIKQLEERILKGEQLNFLEIKAKRPDGKVIDIETKSIMIQFNGKIAFQTIFNDITYRKGVERTLKESEEKFRLLSSNAPIGIFLCNKEGHFLYKNEKLSSIAGESLNNIASLLNSLHPQEEKQVKQEILKSLQSKKDHFVLEFRIKVNFSFIWINFQLSRINKQDKSAWEWVGTIKDITDRKNQELELKQSRENYKSLIETSPDGIMIYKNNEFVFANPTARKIFGLNSTEPVSSDSIYKFILPKYHKTLKARLNRIAPGKTGYFEIALYDSIGNIIEAEAQPISFNFMGEPAIMLVLHDFTNQKQLAKEQLRAQIAEEANEELVKEITEHKKTQQKLIDTEKYTRNIIDSSLDMICATDSFGNITEFNKAAQIVFEYTPDEVIGKSADVLYQAKADYSMVSEEILFKGKFEGEVINVSKSGKKFISYLAAASLFDNDGKFIGVMGVSRDITQTKQAERELRLSEGKYKAIYNQAYIGIARVGLTRGNFIEVNQRLCDILGYTANELINLTSWDITHPDDLYTNLPERKEFLQKKSDRLSTEKRLLHKNGSLIYTNLTISLIRDNEGKPDYFVSVYEDITERKNSENNLKISEEKYRAIYNQIYVGIGRVGLDGKFLQANSQLCEMVGYSEQELVDKTFMDLTVEDDIEKSFEFRKKLLSAEIENFTTEKKYYHKSGAIVFINLTSSLVKDAVGKPAYFLSVFHDITEKKKAEQQISSQTARLNAIFQSPSHQFFTINRNFILTSFNETYSDTIFGHFGVRPFEGLDIYEATKNYLTEQQHNEQHNCHQHALLGYPQAHLTKVVSPNGNIFYYETHLNPIVLPDGSIDEISYVTQDITEKVISQEEIKKSLHEKEVLLKEVHHRVKNNLQVISSILNLQSSYIKDKKSLELLRESQNRIKSMSFIHESLYQTKDFSGINFSEYVANLTKNLVHSYRVNEVAVDLQLNVKPVHLNLDMAIPCGLIINELVSNSLKYAFPGAAKGSICLSLEQCDQKVNIRLKDNGVGLPENIDFRNTESLGLQLVVTLVEQLDGTIDLIPEKGTGYLITFKNSPQKQN